MARRVTSASPDRAGAFRLAYWRDDEGDLRLVVVEGDDDHARLVGWVENDQDREDRGGPDDEAGQSQ